jgi:uncharacterized damage-inducible protein DinB
VEFDLDRTRSLLVRTPGTLSAWLRDLPDAWVRQNEGPGTWSAYDIVGHLIHGERTDWIPRARIVLQQGEPKVFEPFDRFGQFQYPENESLNDRLERFSALRNESLVALDAMHLSAEQLELTGVHPELGTVTLKQLLATWAVHDLGHVAQVARVMAKGYALEVGPWTAYLSILGR